ncbi:MAG: 3'-5' exonuclease [Desulfovibrio sp.]|nr:3'-5' exonuclease [Desulfovibrio sp.]
MQPTIVAIDFETSHKEAYSACAVGLTRIENGVIVEDFYTLIKPPFTDVWFTEVHGLTWRHLKHAPNFVSVWPKIADFIEPAEYLLAHNASFDRRVLTQTLCYHKIEVQIPPFLCTLRGAKRALKLTSNALNVVADYFHIPLHHHHAGSDARACAEIYLRFKDMGLSEREMCIKS